MEQYYKAEENGFVLPQEGDIKAIKNDYKITAKTSEKKVKHFKLKYTAAIAACMAVVMGMTLFINVFNKKEKNPEYSDGGHKYSDGVRYIDSITEWFGEEGLEISFKQMNIGGGQMQSLMAGSSSSVSFLSAGTDKVTLSEASLPEFDDSELPEWVYYVRHRNSRYAELSDYEDTKSLMYDLETGEVFDFYGEIRERFGLVRGDSLKLGMYNCTDWVYAYNTRDEGYYIINRDEGIYKKLNLRLPASSEVDKVNFSDDFKHLFYMHYINEKGYFIYYNTETEESYALEVLAAEGKKAIFDLDGLVEFTPDNKYVVINVRADNYGFSGFEHEWNGSEWIDIYYDEWFVFDIEAKTSWYGKGQIIRYAESGKAIIVKTPEGGKVLSLPGLEDVTDTCELEPYELYELRSKKVVDENGNESGTYYLSPLFGGKEIVVIENVRYRYGDVFYWLRYNSETDHPEYLIFNCYGSDDLWMYSLTRNEMCKLDDSNFPLSKTNCAAMSVVFSKEENKLIVLIWTRSGKSTTDTEKV